MSEKAFTLTDKMGSFYIQPVDQFYDDQTITSFISDIHRQIRDFMKKNLISKFQKL